MKKDNQIIWIIGIIIILIVVANQPKQEMVELTPHFYKDGFEVFPEIGLFGLVTPPGEIYDEISFDIYGTNIGNVNITNIQIVNASPQIFKDALQSGTIYSNELIVEKPRKLLWSSISIDTVDLESLLQPVNFWVNVSGEDTHGNIVYEEVESGDIFFSQPLEDLIVEDIITLGGDQEYSSILILPLGVINVDSTIGYLNLTATSIEIQGKIDGNLKSNNTGGACRTEGVYPTNDGYGGFYGAYLGAGGGKGGGKGWHITRGVGGTGGAGATIIGTETGRYEIMSGRGAGGGASGGSGYLCGTSGRSYVGHPGGATILLNAQTITIQGEISVRGGNGGKGGYGGSAPNCGPHAGCGGGGGGGGGASAGMIILNGQTIDISNSNIILQGGSGGPGGAGGTTYGSYYGYPGKNGGTGSGGRLKVFYTDTFLNDGISLNLGVGGTSYITQV